MNETKKYKSDVVFILTHFLGAQKEEISNPNKRR